MENLELISLKELTQNEAVEIEGGNLDPFMHDLGQTFGWLVGMIKNSFTTVAKDEWMLDVPPLTLFG